MRGKLGESVRKLKGQETIFYVDMYLKKKAFTFLFMRMFEISKIIQNILFTISQKGLPLETKNTQNHENRRLDLTVSLFICKPPIEKRWFGKK